MAVDLHDVNCPGCGAPMDGHLCPSSSGSGTPTVVREYVRGTGPRKTAASHPDCPHCGGRIHFNMGATPINIECLWRIYLVGTGKAGPKDKLPEMFLSNMIEAAYWFEEEIRKGKSFSYGKSGGGTYSTRRKTPAGPVGPVTAPLPPGTPAPDPTATAIEAMMAKRSKEEPAAPPKEPTKDELRAKRREMLKARSKK